MSRVKVILDKQELERYIKQGYNKKQLCEIYNIEVGTLRRVLKEYNLIIPRKYSEKNKGLRITVRPDINKQWLIDNWVNTPYSITYLEERENAKGIIESRRALFGVVKKFKYKVNTLKLFNIEDPNIWYIAGLIATDGYLAEHPDSFEIDLTGDSEKELLEDIKNYLESTSSINKYGKSYRLKICAEGIREFLFENFNIPFHSKTFEVGVPQNIFNEDCAKAYILGCLDGDGCIRNNIVSICNGSFKFISGLKGIIERYLNFDVPLRLEERKQTNNKYPIISLTGKKKETLLDWVYSSTCCLKLKRKYLKYKGNDIV